MDSKKENKKGKVKLYGIDIKKRKDIKQKIHIQILQFINKY